MNSTLYSADRVTHLKIVVVGLALATVITSLAVALRVSNPGPEIFARQAPSVMTPVTGFAAADMPVTIR
jgi:hypothetical protein